MIRDVVIVGAGPAGLATAISATRALPGAQTRILVLDAATFPRYKACGGGVTTLGLRTFAQLGLRPGVLDPSPIHQLEVAAGRRRSIFKREPPFFTVFDRTELDAWLLGQARVLGIEVREGARVVGAERSDRAITLLLGNSTIETAVVVAADGANSTVARSLVGGAVPLARLLEGVAARPVGARADRAVFDFSSGGSDCHQGYSWTFPFSRGDQQLVNVGIYHSSSLHSDRRPALRPLLAAYANLQGIKDGMFVSSHPLRRWTPAARPAGGAVLAVGDALGVDPLFGEGIAFALIHGLLAGQALASAQFDPTASATIYSSNLRFHPIWREMTRRQRLAQAIYGHRGHVLLPALLWGATNVERARQRR